MSKVFAEFKHYWWQLIVLVAAVLGSTFASMGLPMYLGLIIDNAIAKNDTNLLGQYVGVMVIMVIIMIVCGILTAKLAAFMAMSIGRNIRAQVFEKVQNFSQEEIDKFSVSSLITRTNNDIMQVQTFLDQCLNLAIMAPIMAIMGIALSVQTAPSLACVLIISIPVLAIILVFIGKKALPLSTSLQKKLDHMNMVSREKLTGVRVIRAFGTNDFEEKRFDDINTDFRKTNTKFQNCLNAFMPCIILVIAFSIVAILFLAYYLNTEKGVAYTTGEITAIISYVMQILVGITMLTVVILLLPRAATSAKRAKEVLDSLSKINNPEEPKDQTEKQGYLSFKNVSFTYAGADTPAIQGLSFDAKPGETTAIIGGTGMGKTTIVNLIPRLYDATEGEILVDGINVKDYDIEVLRKKIGYVPQKALLFKGTIESNLAFGDENPTEDRIETAVRIAQSYDFVTSKEDGFNSEVAQGGTNFSGGQKQRLCIARAIVRKPEIYIFDDSFSALDFKTDKNLREALKAETDNATTIIVAQRVSTIKEADRIIVVEKGEIAGIGTHKELLATCDVYKEICMSQMSKEEMEK